MCPNEPGASLSAEIAAAGRAFQDDLANPALAAGALIRDAMRETAETIENTLVRATRTGRLSFSDMVRSIAADLGRIAINRFVTQPLAGALTSALSGIFGGARADGGPVAPGRAYLVGERGPELFVPGGSGAIKPNAGMGGGVTINVMARDVESFRRSQAQLAALAARLTARAGRNA
jgi:phage-related minor tail protein